MATQNNVVIATFGTGRDARTRSLFQYDYGIILKIEGIELPSTYEVHFTNFEHMGQATVVIGGSSGEITIPQASLANGNDIEAYIYLHASGSDGETVYHVKIPIIPRAKPNYDTPTPEEQTVMQTLIAQTAEATQAANKAASDANDLLDDIPAAVAEVEAAVEAKGDEVLASIPADYTSLTNQVNRIDDSINNANTGVWKAISDIHTVNRNQDDRIAELKAVAIYTTPESFGAVGDGVADDTTAVQNAFNSDLPVLLTKKYAISSGLTIDKDKYVICDADAEILPIANIETMLTVGGDTTEPTNPVMPGLIKVIWSGGTFNCENGSYKAEVGIDLQKLYHSKFSDISIINVNYGIGMSWSGTYGALAIAENVAVRGSASRMAKYGFKIARNDQRLYNCSAVDCLDGYLIQNAYTRLFGCHVWVTRSLNWANTFGYRVNANHCGFIECTVDTVHTGFIFTSSVQTCVITNLFWLNNTDVVPNYSGMTLFQGINTTDYISVQCSVNNLQCQSFTQDVTLKKYLADNNMFPIISLEANDVSHITDYNIVIQPEIVINKIGSVEALAQQALQNATNVGNHLAETDNAVAELRTALDNVSIDPDDLGLYQDEDTYYVYPTYRGVRSENGIPLAGGSGGGGGGEVIDAKLTVENTSGFLSKTIATGSSCVVSFSWSSIEDEMPTGDGTMRITVNESIRASIQIQQGNVSIDLAPYLSSGSNKVKVRISDIYDQGKTTTFTITAIELSISSSFDVSTPFSDAIVFPYIPVGEVAKIVHFILDGTEIGTQETSVSGRQLSYNIPAQSHGSHTLRVYFESIINQETVRSNELYYNFIAIESGNRNVIIVSPYNKTTETQYTSIAFPFTVYDPSALSANVILSVNGSQVAALTVDRTEQSFTYRADTAGTLTFSIASGGTTKNIIVNITELQIDVEPETEALALYLTSNGRSNLEEHPEVWKYNNISATLSNFSFSSDGWQKDEDNITVLRVLGDARVTIPYQPFANDFRRTGKTIEIEFATRNVLNYDAVVISCMSGGRGINITAQRAGLTSEQSSISTQYKEDEHVRVSFVCEKTTENRLLLIYTNGIMSGAVQYPETDDFSQVDPVNISIGSNGCTTDIYCIRVYDNDLTRYQILDNWIADTQDGGLMLERYTRNNIYDAYGNVVISKLPSNLPYFIQTADELPQYKGDKKTVSGSYTDPMYPSKSFEYTGAQSDVQGTSSQYYPRKNYKIKFKGGFKMSSGTVVDTYAINNKAIPVNTFTMKADVASSEGANNVELARLYNDACPYKTPAQLLNPKVRQGIDGFPMVMFWNDGSRTSFLGKYNFNNDKGTEEVFGFKNGDESWEILNNTSDRVRWKSDDYSGSAWLSDFEARYPDTEPAYQNSAQLAEFARWVKSTDRSQATEKNLLNPVTYDGVEYTVDTEEYRLAKFKAEAANYMEMDSALFYYLFTELFLMVDSRVKNAFPSFMGSDINA